MLDEAASLAPDLEADRSRDVDARRHPSRILHILKHCGYGNGSVHVAVDLACIQAKAGREVIVVSAGGTFVDMLSQHGVRHVKMFQDLRHPFASLLSAVRLVRLCATFKPDIIHAHMMGGAMLAYLSAKLHGLPLVTTVHNSFDRHSVIMRLGDQVVAVSGAEKAQLIRKGYRPDRVSVVVNAPNHSPREDFLGAAKTYTLARPCVTVICGLHRRKGVFDVIDAFHQVSDEFNEWHLYIAGEGPDSGLLQGKVASLGLAGRVTFLGFVSSPRPIFEQTDIFVLASYADPGSLSIGEARAAGCAIIATAVGGTPEMLDFGAAGMLVPPGEPGRMAAKMRLLMHDPAARSSIGAAARAGAATFDVDRLLARYDEVYIKAATCLRPSGALPA